MFKKEFELGLRADDDGTVRLAVPRPGDVAAENVLTQSEAIKFAGQLLTAAKDAHVTHWKQVEPGDGIEVRPTWVRVGDGGGDGADLIIYFGDAALRFFVTTEIVQELYERAKASG